MRSKVVRGSENSEGLCGGVTPESLIEDRKTGVELPRGFCLYVGSVWAIGRRMTANIR